MMESLCIAKNPSTITRRLEKITNLQLVEDAPNAMDTWSLTQNFAVCVARIQSSLCFSIYEVFLKNCIRCSRNNSLTRVLIKFQIIVKNTYTVFLIIGFDTRNSQIWIFLDFKPWQKILDHWIKSPQNSRQASSNL